jgi:hypothetical protein
VAEDILKDDPLLEKDENHLLKKQVAKLTSRKMNWSMIS